jgi:hypothetical protein
VPHKRNASRYDVTGPDMPERRTARQIAPAAGAYERGSHERQHRRCQNSSWVN